MRSRVAASASMKRISDEFRDVVFVSITRVRSGATWSLVVGFLGYGTWTVAPVTVWMPRWICPLSVPCHAPKHLRGRYHSLKSRHMGCQSGFEGLFKWPHKLPEFIQVLPHELSGTQRSLGGVQTPLTVAECQKTFYRLRAGSREFWSLRRQVCARSRSSSRGCLSCQCGLSDAPPLQHVHDPHIRVLLIRSALSGRTFHLLASVIQICTIAF